MLHAIALKTLGLALAVFAAPVSAGDKPSPEAFARVNIALAEDHVRPRYERLAARAEAFEAAVDSLCKGPEPSAHAKAQDEFHALMDAWMDVEHLRFGPSDMLMRVHRFHFWPQAHGKVDKALAKMLADGNAGLPSRIGGASVAVQGLLAAEALLYTSEAEYAGPGGGSARCSLLAAVAGNMREMADGIDAEWWRGPDPFIRLLTGPGPVNPYFETHGEGALAFLKSLHDGLQRVADLKIKPVIGKDIGMVRPYLAESGRSGRSIRNIVRNLEALQELYDGNGGPGIAALVRASDPKLEQLLHKGFRATIATARSLTGPLEAVAADPAQRPMAKKLHVQVRALRQIVRNRLAGALGLPIGFNALDGD